MQVELRDFNNFEAIQSLEVNDSLFNVDFKEGLVHQVVTSILSGRRQGSKQQKNRAAVSGGGAKPWRQKGTGRARAGTTRGPIWRKGGVTFAACPRNYSKKINKKEYKLALLSVVSELFRQERIKVCSNLQVKSHKTKELVGVLQQHSLQNCLIVVESDENNLILAARNLYNIDVVTYRNINPYNLIAYENVLFSKEALEKLTEAYI